MKQDKRNLRGGGLTETNKQTASYRSRLHPACHNRWMAFRPVRNAKGEE